jgi:hypothetical protein
MYFSLNAEKEERTHLPFGVALQMDISFARGTQLLSILSSAVSRDQDRDPSWKT